MGDAAGTGRVALPAGVAAIGGHYASQQAAFRERCSALARLSRLVLLLLAQFGASAARSMSSRCRSA